MKLGLGLVIAAVAASSSIVAHASPTTPDILFINRCVGGCTLSEGGDDAKAHMSTGVHGTNKVLTEFNHPQGAADNDMMWSMVMQCVREVYSPFNVTVTDVRPDDNTIYNEGDLAGHSSDIGASNQVLGFATQEPCSNPAHNVIAFGFANDMPNEFDPQHTAWSLCGLIAQETGHAYGLDHELQWDDTKKPACNSPMTYLNMCGQQFFRNEPANCGDFAGQFHSCRCAMPQNSHLRLLGVLGQGTPITAPPAAMVLTPAAGATMPKTGGTVTVRASAQRGVRRSQLIVNGWPWGDPVDGAPFGSNGQPETTYTLKLPDDLPDGTLDIQVKVSDDLDIATTTPVVRVQKGNKCADAAADCANGQQCDGDGRCYWDPPSGNLGDTCSYPQFCNSGLCEGIQGEPTMSCSQTCILSSMDSCPMGYDCIPASDSQGYCFKHEASSGGCCSIGNEAAAQSVLVGLGLVVVVGRRRRRK